MRSAPPPWSVVVVSISLSVFFLQAHPLIAASAGEAPRGRRHVSMRTPILLLRVHLHILASTQHPAQHCTACLALPVPEQRPLTPPPATALLRACACLHCRSVVLCMPANKCNAAAAAAAAAAAGGITGSHVEQHPTHAEVVCRTPVAGPPCSALVHAILSRHGRQRCNDALHALRLLSACRRNSRDAHAAHALVPLLLLLARCLAFTMSHRHSQGCGVCHKLGTDPGE